MAVAYGEREQACQELADPMAIADVEVLTAGVWENRDRIAGDDVGLTEEDRRHPLPEIGLGWRSVMFAEGRVERIHE